jgi:hypothetical protein
MVAVAPCIKHVPKQRSYTAMNESIFQRKNQDIVDLFESAAHPKKVACVAIDYAKGTHVALICDGEGKRLKAAFPVENNADGLAYITECVNRICKKRHISHNHVFFGGENEKKGSNI